MSTVELSIRGLPDWLIRVYFEEMGASVEAGDDGGEARMSADGWAVAWSSRRVALPGGTIGLTQFDLVFSGDAGAVEQAHELFLKKAQRGGG
ncbi:MAG: hypothetical protein QF664_11480 [Dehalococcoidia bacterium]|nr:hypothetical protein [Dehalococcoidia bacterium]